VARRQNQCTGVGHIPRCLTDMGHWQEEERMGQRASGRVNLSSYTDYYDRLLGSARYAILYAYLTLILIYMPASLYLWWEHWQPKEQ
jgi:hypothetical protein